MHSGIQVNDKSSAPPFTPQLALPRVCRKSKEWGLPLITTARRGEPLRAGSGLSGFHEATLVVSNTYDPSRTTHEVAAFAVDMRGDEIPAGVCQLFTFGGRLLSTPTGLHYGGQSRHCGSWEHPCWLRCRHPSLTRRLGFFCPVVATPRASLYHIRWRQ